MSSETKAPGLGTLPEALTDAVVVVPLKYPVGGISSVAVRKWSFTKMLSMLSIVGAMVGDLPAEVLNDVKAGKANQQLVPILEALGKRLLTVLEQSVDPASRGAIADLDMEDGLTILGVILKQNLNKDVVGKVAALGSAVSLSKLTEMGKPTMR